MEYISVEFPCLFTLLKNYYCFYDQEYSHAQYPFLSANILPISVVVKAIKLFWGGTAITANLLPQLFNLLRTFRLVNQPFHPTKTVALFLLSDSLLTVWCVSALIYDVSA